MFDAGEGSGEDETYYGGPNGHADSDDDDDFAEAHGAFATPAGSNMGDDDEHAIGDASTCRNILLIGSCPHCGHVPMKGCVTAVMAIPPTVAASQHTCNDPQADSLIGIFQMITLRYTCGSTAARAWCLVQ